MTDERESVQKKTFQKWVNSHLVRVGCRIGDLYVDMRDGKQLIKLLEVLSGERLVRNIVYCLYNISNITVVLMNPGGFGRSILDPIKGTIFHNSQIERDSSELIAISKCIIPGQITFLL